MKYLRLLLFPFSLIYGAVIWCRNRLYDLGVLHQTSFDLPVIVVGNLEIGGTGKSPMIEYLIRLLKVNYKIATLSRGYGRRTKGFLEAQPGTSAMDLGDEPLQFKMKFPDITVAVQENRVAGMEILKKDHDLVLLDDAYQHRALKPGLSILLFDYNQLNDIKILFPAGNLRDRISERRRADIMVVTKCPKDLDHNSKQKISRQLEVSGRRIPIFFTGISYSDPIPYNRMISDGQSQAPETAPPKLEDFQQALIVTGIARPAPFEAYVRSGITRVETLTFPDHHPFSVGDINLIGKKFEAMNSERKVILTTEKDKMRLIAKEFADQLMEWPLYYIPIRVEFLGNEGKEFDRQILEYCRKASHSFASQ